MAAVTNLSDFTKWCKCLFIERQHYRGYSGMLPEGINLNEKDIEVLSSSDTGNGYTCFLGTVIPEDRIYARYMYDNKTRELHENVFEQLSRITYGGMTNDFIDGEVGIW